MRHDRRLDARPRKIGARRAVAPALVALVAAGAFLPSLANGFVAWDDDKNFLNNPHYRGLGAEQLHWMWTTFHLGHYVPLTWMTLGLDYTLWGMNPLGYHLTSMVLHAANAVLLYFIARRLLPRALPDLDETTCVLASMIAALLFAVHPLRVESVAWVTERRDVLAGFFYMVAILCYLRAVEPADKIRRRWYAGAIAAFACALLSKATAVTLPATLLLLDVYPLRRFSRRVWLELAPFALLSAGAGVLSIVALHPPAQLTLAQKLAVSAYALLFYIGKTLLPIRLSPLYELPQHVDPLAMRYVASYVIVVVAATLGWRYRRRWPGIDAAAIAFVIAILPMLGVVQNGPQVAADRYSYFAAPPLALLAAGLVAWYTTGRRAATTGFGAAFAVVLLLAALTWHQTQVWHDTESLWSRVLAEDDGSSIGHVGMATLLLSQNRVADAAPHAERAVALAPTYAQAHNDLGIVYARTGDTGAAIREYETAIRLEPSYDEPHSNLGMILAARGDVPGAVTQYQAAIALNPDAANAHVNWGNALVRAGQPADAAQHYAQALAIRPDDADAELNWGVALAVQRRFAEAAEHFRRALELNPQSEAARAYLDRAVRLGGG